MCPDDAVWVKCVLSPGSGRHSANCRWRPCIHCMQLPTSPSPAGGPRRPAGFRTGAQVQVTSRPSTGGQERPEFRAESQMPALMTHICALHGHLGSTGPWWPWLREMPLPPCKRRPPEPPLWPWAGCCPLSRKASVLRLLPGSWARRQGPDHFLLLEPLLQQALGSRSPRPPVLRLLCH